MLVNLALVLFGGLLQAVLAAGPVEILNPSPKTIWKIGQKVQIKWNATALAHPPSTKATIALASGPATALTISHVIAKDVDTHSGSYNWTIPKTVKPNDKYVLEVGINAKDISFAGWISIIDDALIPIPTPATNGTQNARPKKKKQPKLCRVVHMEDGEIEIRCRTRPSTSQKPKRPVPSSTTKPKKSAAHKHEKPTPTPKPTPHMLPTLSQSNGQLIPPLAVCQEANYKLPVECPQ
ncbi:hypothetical protein EC973_002370 [Apophysomyces ossiformis]|uniref:Yeast cell wall synthesis Kre9/Knh1-like N-terminal domain-containing protein n=1 Tax=Apophysomyces ossiformis TaxID=679940 RepID=A0A8H7BNV7_9FUNG|nr:hypothetical protein EC973_002370 [Apophysomyces ossiformis]